MTESLSTQQLLDLKHRIGQWSRDLGFQAFGVADTELDEHGNRLEAWLAKGFHGEMEYMERHGAMRYQPDQLVAGTTRIISVRMDYMPPDVAPWDDVLEQPSKAYVSRYALGRDYHKLMRKRLVKLGDKIRNEIGPFGYRAFVDSAPVLEKAVAQKAGLGWIGKHSNLLHQKTGSWFFLGELFTDLPLPVDQPATEHCGSCSRCIPACPTDAIVGPYQVDARRCISYLTIELRSSIPESLRPAMGNRIYGCDDCQIACPWNKFSEPTDEADFHPRHNLDDADLIALFAWSEEAFLKNTEGSAIRRIGHDCWLRNIAVALGNEAYSESVIAALKSRESHPSELVKEHVQWALEQQFEKRDRARGDQ